MATEFLKIWASSHGRPKYQVGEFLKAEMAAQNRYSRPEWDWQGGRKITQGLVNQIKSDMDLRSGSPQVHVLILGTNNLREGNSPAHVSGLFKQVLAHSGIIPKCRVIVVGLLPSVKNDNKNKDAFRECNKQIQLMVQTEYRGHAQIIKMWHRFTYSGEVMQSLFRRDGIHLNSSGAKIYAQALWNHLRMLPRVN